MGEGQILSLAMELEYSDGGAVACQIQARLATDPSEHFDEALVSKFFNQTALVAKQIILVYYRFVAGFLK